jgi:hypothetical protein
VAVRTITLFVFLLLGAVIAHLLPLFAAAVLLCSAIVNSLSEFFESQLIIAFFCQ